MFALQWVGMKFLGRLSVDRFAGVKLPGAGEGCPSPYDATPQSAFRYLDAAGGGR